MSYRVDYALPHACWKSLAYVSIVSIFQDASGPKNAFKKNGIENAKKKTDEKNVLEMLEMLEIVSIF